jgi:hypothetical protein
MERIIVRLEKGDDQSRDIKEIIVRNKKEKIRVRI